MNPTTVTLLPPQILTQLISYADDDIDRILGYLSATDIDGLLELISYWLDYIKYYK